MGFGRAASQSLPVMVSSFNLFIQYSFNIHLLIQYFNIYSFNIYWTSILRQAFLHLNLIKVMALPFSYMFGDHLWDKYEKSIAHTVFSAKWSGDSTLFVCLEIICEIKIKLKLIPHTIVYLNDLFRNNYSSSVEVLRGKGHILGIIPKYLELS